MLSLLPLWVVLLRAPIFVRSAADWDESLYILTASQWLEGHLPYTTVFDLKPVGIFAIFSVALGLLGDAVLSIRLVTVLFVYATSGALFLLGRRLFGDVTSALIAAFSYPVFTLGMEGLASNTELFFIFFNIVGLLLLLSALEQIGRRRWAHIFLAGLAFGVALQIKYIVVIEIGFFVIYFAWVGRLSVKQVAQLAPVFTLGVVLPTGLAMFYFWANDLLDVFLYANFEANRRYLGILSGEYWPGVRHSLQDWVKWSWLAVTAIIWLEILGRPDTHYQLARRFFLLWLLVGFLESWATLKFYPHYYLVTMAPLSLLLAGAVGRYPAAGGRRFTVGLLLILVLGFPFARTIDKYYSPWIREYLARGDPDVILATYIRERIDPGDYIYVVNGHPIIYYLARAKLPTKYVLPPLILSRDFSHVAGVAYPAEVDRIFSLQPRYILVKDQREANKRLKEITDRLAGSYIPDSRIDDTTIYVRRDLDTSK